MKCPKCSYEPVFDTDRCKMCGYDFSTPAIVTMQAVPAQKECPRCHKKAGLDTHFCGCGFDFRNLPPTITEINDGKCPFCKGEIEPGVLKCRHCGEWLDAEHQKKEAAVVKAQMQTGNTAKVIGWMIAGPIILGVLFKMCEAAR